MKFSSFDGREDGEYNGVGLVKVFRIFATPQAFVFGTTSFGAVKYKMVEDTTWAQNSL